MHAPPTQPNQIPCNAPNVQVRGLTAAEVDALNADLAAEARDDEERRKLPSLRLLGMVVRNKYFAFLAVVNFIAGGYIVSPLHAGLLGV